MRSRYLALEGIEGAGKSTIAELTANALRSEGREVIVVREPGGTPVGEGIRRLLLHEGNLEPWTEALLFAAQRAQLAAGVIDPALGEGRWVVSDRSVYSSLAYQGEGRGLGLDRVRAINEPGLGRVWPDLVVLLRITPEEGEARQQVPDRIGAEGREFLTRVGAAYDAMAAAEPGRFAVIDASRPVDEVVDEVLAAIGAQG